MTYRGRRLLPSYVKMFMYGMEPTVHPYYLFKVGLKVYYFDLSVEWIYTKNKGKGGFIWFKFLITTTSFHIPIN